MAARTLPQHDRKEVVADPKPIVGSDCGLNLFQHPCGDKPNGPKYSRIRGKQDWHTWDAAGQKLQPPIMSLTRSMDEHSNWEMAASVWRSAVIPRHEVILQKHEGQPWEIWYSLRPTPFGVLAWPVVRAGKRGIMLDPSVTELVHKQVVSFQGLVVVETFPVSPLHNFLQQEFDATSMGIMLRRGNQVDVIDFQARRGFPLITELILTKLGASRKMKIPDVDEGFDAETWLADQLSMDCLPKATPEELCEAINTRITATEDNNIEPWDFIRDVDVEDVVSSSDKKKLREQAAKNKTQSEVNQKLKTCVAQAICKQFGLKTLNLGGKKFKPIVGKAAIDRWWASIPGDASFLMSNKPEPGRVFTDNWNGRFRVSYRDETPRSISWTKVGAHVASIEALRVLWHWHRKYTGEDIPLPFT